MGRPLDGQVNQVDTLEGGSVIAKDLQDSKMRAVDSDSLLGYEFHESAVVAVPEEGEKSLAPCFGDQGTGEKGPGFEVCALF